MKVVTLAGAVISKNGNMTGGTASFEDSASHWEQKDIEEVGNHTVPACFGVTHTCVTWCLPVRLALPRTALDVTGCWQS